MSQEKNVKLNRELNSEPLPLYTNGQSINRCPTVIFSANRTANVPGSNYISIVSVHTINTTRIGGVPIVPSRIDYNDSLKCFS